MLKLVVFCVVVVTVAAKPSIFPAARLITPFSYSSVVAPATTTITKQENNIVHPLPHHYSVPLVYKHVIKKRSTLLDLPVSNCSPSTYIASPFILPSPISPFPYLIPQTYFVPAPFTAPLKHILNNPVPTYTAESTIPINVEALKNDVFKNMFFKNDATSNLRTEATKYEAMKEYIGVVNMDSTNKEAVQRDSYGKPLMNSAIVASKTQNCMYDLKALFEDGSLICKDPQNIKHIE